ncbi:hypothetical protein [Pseudoteredinibacter isoporae]|uniref:hypothetical protein n=1 Tax=Pseudoteredinibacter isoporae TaxID=570281 RepID=UPI003102BA3B
MWFALALTTQAAMMSCLFFSWQSPDHRKPGFRGAALFALVASLFCWQSLAGWELGLSYFFIAASLMAWVLILNRATRTKPARSKPKTTQALSINTRKLAMFFVRLVFYVLFIGGICAYASIAISYDLPLGEPERMAVATFLFPSLWAGFIIYSFTAERLWRLFALLIFLALYAWLRLA